MKLLHTSDWHLGKKLYGKDLSVYQDSIIDEIAFIAENKNVDVVIVSGNVFAANVLNSVSLNLFLKAVAKITAGGKRAMIVTLGESDNKEVLDSFSYLSSKFNFACITSSSSVVDFDENAVFETRPVESGRGYMVYETKNQERVVVGGVCIPTIELKGEETLEEGVLKCVDTVTRRFSIDSVNIIAANANLEMPEESPEQGKLSVRLFPYDTTYVALGGLKSSEACDFDKNAYYSGSIMPYDSEDSKGDKSVIIATISENKEVKKEIVKLKSSKKLRKIRSSSLSDAEAQLLKYEDCLVDLTLSVADPLKDSENKKLFVAHPNLIHLNLVVSSYRAEKKKRKSRLNLSGKELFSSFVLDTTQDAVDNELSEMFCKLIGE